MKVAPLWPHAERDGPSLMDPRFAGFPRNPRPDEMTMPMGAHQTGSGTPPRSSRALHRDRARRRRIENQTCESAAELDHLLNCCADVPSDQPIAVGCIGVVGQHNLYAIPRRQCRCRTFGLAIVWNAMTAPPWGGPERDSRKRSVTLQA